MPFNGTGVFQRVRNWVADAAAGIKIRADYHDAEDDGFATGLTNCITKDGQTIITQNIPWNSKRITGLQDPVNPQDAATKSYADTAFTSGGTMTGDLTIKKDGPQLVLDDTDAHGVSLVGQHMDKTRWILHLGNADAETGTGSAGSNYDLLRYADDGTTLLGTSMVIERATGKTTLNGDLIVASAATTGTIFLGSDGLHSFKFDGTAYTLLTSKLTLGAQGASGNDAVTWDQLNTKQANLGFTPVQQGGGNTQGANKIYIGWGTGGLRAQVDGSDLGNFVFGSGALAGGRLAYAGDIAVVLAPGGMYEPYGGAVVTGFEWTNVGYPVITYLRFRYMQLQNSAGAWFTVGYV